MPTVKIKLVVSFTSQCNRHPCESILREEKWLSNPADKSGKLEAIFQLENASRITNIDIGTVWAMTLQIQVGRSSWPLSQQYEVLFNQKTLMMPRDCRMGEKIVSMQMLNCDHFTSAKDQEWDRVKVILTQPFRKDRQFGLSLLKIQRLSTEDDESASKTPERVMQQSRLENRLVSPRSTPSTSDIQKHFFGKESKQVERADQVKDQILKVSKTAEHGSEQAASLSRTGQMVIEASKNTPHYKGQTPPTVKRRTKVPFEKEVEEFLKTLDRSVLDLDNTTYADLRHLLEKKKCRKLSKEERKVFRDKVQAFLDEDQENTSESTVNRDETSTASSSVGKSSSPQNHMLQPDPTRLRPQSLFGSTTSGTSTSEIVARPNTSAHNTHALPPQGITSPRIVGLTPEQRQRVEKYEKSVGKMPQERTKPSGQAGREQRAVPKAATSQMVAHNATAAQLSCNPPLPIRMAHPLQMSSAANVQLIGGERSPTIRPVASAAQGRRPDIIFVNPPSHTGPITQQTVSHVRQVGQATNSSGIITPRASPYGANGAMIQTTRPLTPHGVAFPTATVRSSTPISRIPNHLQVQPATVRSFEEMLGPNSSTEGVWLSKSNPPAHSPVCTPTHGRGRGQGTSNQSRNGSSPAVVAAVATPKVSSSSGSSQSSTPTNRGRAKCRGTRGPLTPPPPSKLSDISKDWSDDDIEIIGEPVPEQQVPSKGKKTKKRKRKANLDALRAALHNHSQSQCLNETQDTSFELDEPPAKRRSAPSSPVDDVTSSVNMNDGAAAMRSFVMDTSDVEELPDLDGSHVSNNHSTSAPRVPVSPPLQADECGLCKHPATVKIPDPATVVVPPSAPRRGGREKRTPAKLGRIRPNLMDTHMAICGVIGSDDEDTTLADPVAYDLNQIEPTSRGSNQASTSSQNVEIPTSRCPICYRDVPSYEINFHVNICLDSM